MKQFFTYLTKYQGEIKKFFVALGVLIASAIAFAADGSVTGTEWLAMALEFLGALGVYAVPNGSTANHETTKLDA